METAGYIYFGLVLLIFVPLLFFWAAIHVVKVIKDENGASIICGCIGFWILIMYAIALKSLLVDSSISIS
jgi:hypothetical protein